MSERGTGPTVVVDEEDWEVVLARLRADGFSPLESIKVTRAVLRLSLAEAKRVVHESRAWVDARSGFDEIHDALADAAESV